MRLIAIGVRAAGAAAIGGLLFVATVSHASPSGKADRPLVLQERSDCGVNGIDGAALDDRIRSAYVEQSLVVQVPATALIKVESGDRVVAAMTNTGCAPRTGDDVYIVRPDGTIERAPTSQMADRRWLGDFTVPGVYVSQTR